MGPLPNLFLGGGDVQRICKSLGLEREDNFAVIKTDTLNIGSRIRKRRA